MPSASAQTSWKVASNWALHASFFLHRALQHKRARNSTTRRIERSQRQSWRNPTEFCVKTPPAFASASVCTRKLWPRGAYGTNAVWYSASARL
mmetsp:Transcript_1761/g.4676  ORF Transcript_1761/g.4676 Transcript_1761/m.4676 type:complete len:93 (-) Transcript_1761:1323-1601(-)